MRYQAALHSVRNRRIVYHISCRRVFQCQWNFPRRRSCVVTRPAIAPLAHATLGISTLARFKWKVGSLETRSSQDFLRRPAGTPSVAVEVWRFAPTRSVLCSLGWQGHPSPQSMACEARHAPSGSRAGRAPCAHARPALCAVPSPLCPLAVEGLSLRACTVVLRVLCDKTRQTFSVNLRGFLCGPL